MNPQLKLNGVYMFMGKKSEKELFWGREINIESVLEPRGMELGG